MRVFRVPLFVLLMLVVAGLACGGGGDGATKPAPTVPIQGVDEHELAALAVHLSYLQDKVAELDGATGSDELEWAAFSPTWNRDLTEHKGAYAKEFGANVNEYKGGCRTAFFDIAVGYGELFILWTRYDGLLEGDVTQAEVEAKHAEFAELLERAEGALETCRED